MEIEKVEQQLLAEAKKQTAALQSLRGIALIWMALVGIALLIWLIGAMSGAGILA